MFQLFIFLKTFLIIQCIRLWGEGQILINRTRLICFGACALSSEALKNLVLAGVGFICIIDDQTSNNKDLKENFFVDRDNILNNFPRGQAVLNKILELNDDCKGEFFKYSLKEFLEKESIKLQTFDIILSANNKFVRFNL